MIIVGIDQSRAETLLADHEEEEEGEIRKEEDNEGAKVRTLFESFKKNDYYCMINSI